MAHLSTQLVSRHLRKLTVRNTDPQPDHQLLQRFVTTHEEAAFAALVERHGSMVLGVCRSILQNHHDAEDIFQATFLVLAKKAGSIRRGESIGSWLYAVAYRLAQKARIRAGKRGVYEQQAPLSPDQTSMDDVTWGELRGILHEEVSRLPDKLRAAVVLCYWEGRTHEQAGQQLGCAKGTVKDRLERARELLRSRLARRGLALSTTWFAASLAGGMASAAVPMSLAQATVRGAILFEIGQLPTGIVSDAAVACARKTMQVMSLAKLKYGLALVIVIGVFGGVGLGALREAVSSANADAPSANAKVPAASAPEREQSDRADGRLPSGVVARLGTLRFRHSDAITRIAVGTDGRSILSAAGNAVYVWDLATGKERRRYQRHETPVTSFVGSRDGKLLASGCQDGTIHLWDADTGRELRHFTAQKGKAPGRVGPAGVFVIGFTPDGRQIVSAGADNTFQLWDAASGEKTREFGRFPEVGSVVLSPDGKTVAGAVKNDKTWELRLWEVPTGRELQRRPQPGKQILSPTFSPDGKQLAITVGEPDWKKPCDIQLWDAEASKEIRTLRGHKSWAWCAFAPDGKTLASSGSDTGDRTGRLWDVNTGKEIGRVGEDKTYFNQLLFCPDGRSMVSYTQGNHHLRFWDRASGDEIRSSEDAFSPVDFLRFSPEGRWLAAGSKSDWAIRLWDVAARKNVRRLEHGLLSGLQFSPDGSRLASAAWTDGQVRIWESATGKKSRRIPADKGTNDINSMAWSDDGKILATWSLADRLVRLWDAETGKPLRTLSAGLDQIESLIFSPDSTRPITLGSELQPPQRTLLLQWEMDTGRQLPSLEAPIGPANAGYYAHPRLAFSPDGRTLAAGGQGAEASIYVWEMISGRLRLTLKQGEDVTALAFSPDGKLLAAANNSNASRHLAIQKRGESPKPRVHLWDMVAEKELPPLEGHQGSVASLAFSPDGKLLATGGNDTTVLLWDATGLRKGTRPAETSPLPASPEVLWADLAGEDAVQAYRAIRALAAAPQASVEFLQRHLHPVRPADSKRVARLLADLDGEDFAAREKAMRELEKLGEATAADLHKALAGKPSLEMKRRIEQLLEAHDSKDHIRMVRALEVLERMGTPEARALCERLAGGAAEARLTREAQATFRRLSR